jgi:hypothetical protein
VSLLQQKFDIYSCAMFHVLIVEKYLERSTEAWQTLFALEAQDCERAASNFVAVHPRGAVSLPNHLKNLGCA